MTNFPSNWVSEKLLERRDSRLDVDTLQRNDGESARLPRQRIQCLLDQFVIRFGGEGHDAVGLRLERQACIGLPSSNVGERCKPYRRRRT